MPAWPAASDKYEAQHGLPGDRRFSYVPLYILRGLEALHIEFIAK